MYLVIPAKYNETINKYKMLKVWLELIAMTLFATNISEEETETENIPFYCSFELVDNILAISFMTT